ncbi:MAG: hypothetical protein KIS77_00495 [Saprospiraceae bacterium]|nr:hypothetical protein [Saprospiraceae bacterium]
MKKSFFNLSVLFITALSFVACKKEKSFEEKVTGEWTSMSVKLNGNDVTNYFSLDLNLRSDKDFRATLKTVNIVTGKNETSYPRGAWSADDGKEIELTYNDTGKTEFYEVLEFTGTKLTVETIQNTDKVEITFERANQ